MVVAMGFLTILTIIGSIAQTTAEVTEKESQDAEDVD